MKKLFLLLFTFCIFISDFTFAQQPEEYSISAAGISDQGKMLKIIDDIHNAVTSGKLKCYKDNLKDVYSLPEARMLGTVSFTKQFNPDPSQPDKIDFKDTIYPFEATKITGYQVDRYKVKIEIKEKKGDETADDAKSKNGEKSKAKAKKNNKKEKSIAENKNKAAGKDKDQSKIKEEKKYKEEKRPAFAPYYEPGNYIYWIRLEDLPKVLPETDINFLKKELLLK